MVGDLQGIRGCGAVAGVLMDERLQGNGVVGRLDAVPADVRDEETEGIAVRGEDIVEIPAGLQDMNIADGELRFREVLRSD